nr:hypothetical protein [Tanacetum cinerariifolium]
MPTRARDRKQWSYHCFIFPATYRPFGPSPSASGGYPHLSDQDSGSLATTTTTGRRLPPSRPPPTAIDLQKIKFPGTLTGKFLELVDTLRRKKVDIACFQETKWKGLHTREGNQYKIWYSGSATARNRVGVVVAPYLKDKVVQVFRISDRIMLVGLVIEEESTNVISAYAPQVGLREAKKKSFWDSLDDLVRECSSTQQLIIAGDLNGHIGANADGFSSVHEGFGYGVRNEEGRTILEFAAAHDLVVANSFFKKRDAHLITFHSRVHDTQIDYMLVRKWDLTLSEAFRARVIEEVIPDEEDRLASDAEQMWNRLANTIREAAKETLGVVAGTLRTHIGHRESYAAEERYKEAKREAKKAVARVKEKAYEDLYKRLDSKEGENDINKIANAKDKRKRDLGIMRFIKDRDGRSIVNEDAIRRRWKEHSEVKEALRKMGRTRRWDLMRSSLKHGGVLEGGDSTGYDVRVRLLAVNEVTIINKMREGRLRWFEHVKRRPKSAPIRRVESLTVDEARRRGIPKFRWEDRPKTDLKEMLLSEDMTSNRKAWRNRIRVVEEVFLEAVPLPSGRGVTVYIPPPLYLVYAGLGNVVVVVVA